MAYIMVDIEADGPIPGDYSMIEIGAVVVDEGLGKTFYATLKPISDTWNHNALSVTGRSRLETMQFADPARSMEDFRSWLHLHSVGHPRFVSDNNGFDWQFVNWYFHHFLGSNPFGFSSTNLGSLYKGLTKDVRKNFKHLRETKHTHHPVDDAKGNAEAMWKMRAMGLSF